MTTLIALALFTIGFAVTFVVPHESADRFLQGTHIIAKLVRVICTLMFAFTLTAFFIARVSVPLSWDGLSNKGILLFTYAVACIFILTAYIFYGTRYSPLLSSVILLLMQVSGFAVIALTKDMLSSRKIAEISSVDTFLYSSVVGIVIFVILSIMSYFIRHKNKEASKIFLYLGSGIISISVFLMLYVLCHNVFYLAAVV